MHPEGSEANTHGASGNTEVEQVALTTSLHLRGKTLDDTAFAELR